MLCLCCVANENNTRYSLVIYHYLIISECCKMLHNINKKQNSRIEVSSQDPFFLACIVRCEILIYSVVLNDGIKHVDVYLILY